ncbi:hypothetical protein Nmel_012745 [Mimus melanotis]
MAPAGGAGEAVSRRRLRARPGRPADKQRRRERLGQCRVPAVGGSPMGSATEAELQPTVSGPKYGASPRLGWVAERSVAFPAVSRGSTGDTCGGRRRGVCLWMRSLLLLPCSKFCLPVTPVLPTVPCLSPHDAL